MSFALKELLLLSYILKDLSIELQLPMDLCCDNKSTKILTENPCFHSWTKHISIDAHFVCD